ncbi:dehydrogenase [Cysteiniphilum litorale]|uniref:Deoxyguanosinetriphosphate triphosphohydrolase-like protein n=1 Tax=Cysteiniphilum litorale TaxID=2056700 RepID=A0A8J2Z1W6_9GAMM|nr:MULTISPECIES: dNTP triphosphohydrolase [Cysteiniphilum]GGF88226.1 dehydrogenase [Cysteiniphilum litorale]
MSSKIKRSLYQEKDYYRGVYESHPKEHFSAFRRDYARVIHSASFRRLQGKTQIFPCSESEFFRNRLTHSLEVAQVAKSIATGLNSRFDLDLDTDLVETAALCHDIGHPPFGHNGEKALHAKMREYGGFEGNAQTLRLLAKTEKKVFKGEGPIHSGKDNRFGLNLTHRTLAATLKYDKEIPSYIINSSDRPIKGYYASEKAMVEKIKQHVLFGYPLDALHGRKFKTIECSIMDLADDIAYSTYDIEDAFKGGFLDPLSMVNAEEKVLIKVQQQAELDGLHLSITDIKAILKSIFEGIIDFDAKFDDVYQQAKKLANSSYLRTKFTSNLVHYCISHVSLNYDEVCPVLSSVSLEPDVYKQVEVLKLFVYFTVISSPKMNVVRYQGREIISSLFDILINSQIETSLLPEDVGEIFYAFDPDDQVNRARVISDFIASMTDRYAIELHNRLTSSSVQSIFKPV